MDAPPDDRVMAERHAHALAVPGAGSPDAVFPLAAASLRLRRKPGRPRNAPAATTSTGDNAGITPSRDRGNRADPDRAGVTLAPARSLHDRGITGDRARLLDVKSAGLYLAVSEWTIRDLVSAGRLPRVRLPLAGDRECRRLLVDVRDLDRLIEATKERA